MSQVEVTMPPTESDLKDCKDLKLYWHEGYKRWTVDVIPPVAAKVERKTFRSLSKAESFARAKKTELVQSGSSKTLNRS